MLQRTQLQEGSNQYSVIKNLLFFLPSLAQRSAALPFPHKLQSAPFCGKGRGPDYRGLGLQAASGHCLLRSTRRICRDVEGAGEVPGHPGQWLNHCKPPPCEILMGSCPCCRHQLLKAVPPLDLYQALQRCHERGLGWLSPAEHRALCHHRRLPHSMDGPWRVVSLWWEGEGIWRSTAAAAASAGLRHYFLPQLREGIIHVHLRDHHPHSGLSSRSNFGFMFSSTWIDVCFCGRDPSCSVWQVLESIS